MVPLYALLVTALAALKSALARRAARTERKYTRAALAAEELARVGQTKPGNGSAADPFAAAKRQYELGRVVEDRDRLETKFVTCQARADAVAGLVNRLTGWKGRAVPYLLGVADLGLVLTALHYLGLPHGLTGETVKAWAETLRM